jgi:hypothetical protein
MLAWDETEVVACLEIVPLVGECGISHAFSVARNGLRLEITVFQYDGDVAISLYRDGLELPIFDVRLLGCEGLRYVNDQRGEHLEFAPARCFGGRYDGTSPMPFGIRVAAKPQVRVTMFSNLAAA